MEAPISVDGPAAAGKGTLSRKLAEHFDLAMLDTGLIYRAVAKKVLEIGNPEDQKVAIRTAQILSLNDLTIEGLRDEAVGAAASIIAAIPEVRSILLKFQREFAEKPPNNKLGASALASCKSQGYRRREGKKSHKIGKRRVTVGGKKIKGKNFTREFTYNNKDNKFDLVKFQNSVKDDLINAIINDIIIFLNSE